MITRSQLRKIHSEKLPLHILEQDYIQALFLQEIQSNSDNLVFKGGTFLKHAQGLDRFSEDLDFTKIGDDDPLIVIEKSVEKMSEYAIEVELKNIKENDLSLTARLRYKGPLYSGSENSIGSVHLEISKREDVFKRPEWVRLFFKYPEIRVVNSLCLNLNEALAEKLRALSSRTKARDLYDVWFLLKAGVRIDKELFKQKMAVIGIEPIVKISITEIDWDQDLKQLLERPPEFVIIKKEVIMILKKAGFVI